MASTKDTTAEVIGMINTMQTLCENFPMNFLNKGKTYTSVIDFILDVLYMIGISEETITSFILESIFKVPNLNEVTTKISSKVTAVSEAMYEKISDMDEIESDFLSDLEDAIKLIIGELLTALLSCSAIPEIPNWYMDALGEKSGREGGAKVECGEISIPIKTIDLFNKLSINPSHRVGSSFYDVKDIQIQIPIGVNASGETVYANSVNVNQLYKTSDLNAFIWYVMNRGTDDPQKEKNKMMWDSRKQAKRNNTYNRTTKETWNYWLNTKERDNDYFYSSGETIPVTLPLDCNDFKDQQLFPILQFFKDDTLTSEPRIKVSIASQRYYRKGTFNKSIYEFNWDYLRSIKIFSSRTLFANMLTRLLNGSLLAGLGLNYSVNEQMTQARLQEIIKRASMTDDMQIEDCFFTFSNEEYNNLLSEALLKRYNANMIGTDTGMGVEYDITSATNNLDKVNNAATSSGQMSEIKRTVYEVSAIPAKDSEWVITDNTLTMTWQNWLSNLINSLLMPIVEQILSPKVMLLFIINFEICGMINLDDLMENGNIDENKLMNLLYKKLSSLIISLVKYVKDKIAIELMKLFNKYIEPLLMEFSAIILLEALNDWIRYLTEALKCIPNFNLGLKNGSNVIDDVNYADITQTQTTPEKTINC